MPKVEQKQVIISAIKEQIEGASSVVVVDYRGLTVEQDTLLRKNLREANVTYKVLKNSMMKFAFEGTEYSKLNDTLAGPSAIAISYDDATAGPRVLKKMAKDMKKLEFKAGVVEGELFDGDGIIKIASVPSRDELLSKLLGSIKAPMGSFARTMKALADKVEAEGKAVAGDLAGAESKAETQAAEVETAKDEVAEAEAKAETEAVEVAETDEASETETK